MEYNINIKYTINIKYKNLIFAVTFGHYNTW